MKLTEARFHFVGIGGIGMCGLAELLHNMGAFVQGSDLSQSTQTQHLQKLGVKVYHGHDRKWVHDIDVLVYSSAICNDNEELIEARTLGVPTILRAEALAEIMRFKRGLAVAGTHGKTTTTSILASIFLEAKMDPTIVVGGRVDLIKSTALLGQGEWIIAEADESDGSFDKLSPELAVITNIDVDHLDHYKSFQNLKTAFYNFALKTPFYGGSIIYGDDKNLRELFCGFAKRVIFYGFDKENDFYLDGKNGTYEVYRRDSQGEHKRLGEFQIDFPGRHNALNALASIVSGLFCGIEFEVCARGVKNFTGVGRRFEFKGESGGVLFYDDYAHHPTEILATLEGFREKFGDTHRLVVMFQPHRYTRTQDMWREFTQCFHKADELIVTDIYPGGESSISGVTSEALCREISHPCVRYIPKKNVINQSLSLIKKGDIYLTLGAGDGFKLGDTLKENIKRSVK